MKKHSSHILVRSISSALLAAGLMCGAMAQGPGPAGPGAAANAEEMQRRQEEQNRRPDTIGTGEFAAMKEEVPSLQAHVIYRPQDLAAMGDTKLGVVAWGNGGCSADAASSRFHLLELASHGYLVIANGNILSGPGAPPRESRQPAAGAPGPNPNPATSAAQMVEAIDWAMAENARQGSPYFGRIDPDMIAVSGFSCGGIQAIGIADDPRVDTVLMMNTGLIVNGETTMGGMTMDKGQLDKVHTPILYILGGETDIAYVNGMDDFEKINHQPAAVANLDVGHGGTYAQENGGIAAQVAVNWLDWVLRGDAAAGQWFLGDDCVLCSDPEWEYESKNLDAVVAR